jgi:hypothetical protein
MKGIEVTPEWVYKCSLGENIRGILAALDEVCPEHKDESFQRAVASLRADLQAVEGKRGENADRNGTEWATSPAAASAPPCSVGCADLAA